MEAPLYFDHQADIGIIGRGGSVEASFEAAARAMFALTTNLTAVLPKETVIVEFEESDPELALVTWLNLLLGKSRERSLVLAYFHLRRDGDTWHGSAQGERWRSELERGVEVKGATLTMLSVVQRDGAWEARCVVDV
ncbi:MAG: archease [Pseudomonadota bacterium]